MLSDQSSAFQDRATQAGHTARHGLWQRMGWALLPLLLGLWLVTAIYAAGHPTWAVLVLALWGIGFYIYLSPRVLAWKYLFPGVLGMLLFVVFPLLYTVQIGFTNYSSAHLLSQEAVKAYLLAQTRLDESALFDAEWVTQGESTRLRLRPAEQDGPAVWITAPVDLQNPPSVPVRLEAAEPAWTGSSVAPWPIAKVIAHRERIQPLRLSLPDGRTLRYVGLREFGVLEDVWTPLDDGSLIHTGTGSRWSPDAQTGFFQNEKGETVQPGFTVGVGWEHYRRLLLDEDLRSPFLSIFLWTILFSALTVALTLALGGTLAVVLNWEALKFKAVYRTLLFLPYAIPGFISILVFKGLFNQNFGEINALLDMIFGVKPAWFSDPILAKTMLLIVNTWLGYPYIMVLCAGLIKSIPADLYEASAIAGAGPLTNFFKITAPLLIKPLTPLLIASFAFNFNNFVLVALLTNGRPDFLSTKVPAGQTDILVSYTYRIAFQDSGQDFGLAAAISTMIFIMVALMSLLNLRLTSGGEPRHKPH